MQKLAERLGEDRELMICEEDEDLLLWRSILDELRTELLSLGRVHPHVVDTDVVMDARGAELLYRRLMRRRDKRTQHIRAVLRRLAKTGHAYSNAWGNNGWIGDRGPRSKEPSP